MHRKGTLGIWNWCNRVGARLVKEFGLGWDVARGREEGSLGSFKWIR